MKRAILLLLLAAIFAGAAFAVVKMDLLPGEADARQVVLPTATVRRGPFQSTVSSIGGLQAATSSLLNSPFSGKITRIVPEGTRVEPGDPVIWFETQEIEEELEERKAQLELDLKDLQVARDNFEMEKRKNEFSLESEQTRVEIARQQVKDAETNYEAEQLLYEQNVSPQVQLEEARLRLLQSRLELRNSQINLAKVEDNLSANLRNKEREIEKSQLRVDNSQRRVADKQREMDEAVLRAQAPGEVNYLQIWKSGTTAKVAEGDTVWQRLSLVEIPDTSVMFASVPISELDIGRIEPGQTAEVRLEALPGQVLSGIVESKSVVPVNNPNWGWVRDENDREYEVKVRLHESNEELFRPGMTAAVSIIVASRDNALQAPLEALFEKDGGTGVYRAPDGEFVALAPVLINENAMVLPEGGSLKEGDALFLLPPDQPATPPVVAAEPDALDEEGEEAPVVDEGAGG